MSRDRNDVDRIKAHYPPGTRIRLNSMDDPWHPIPPGTEGEVDFVDDIGTIHMKWDDGRSLGIVPGEDNFTVLSPKLETLKLYMPLTADLYELDRYGNKTEESSVLEGNELQWFHGQITAAILKRQMPEEAERGLMHWYHKSDSVNTKVRSITFAVEDRGGQLWGVAECHITGKLTAEEMESLKDHITGQAADGWGEGFEQQGISLGGYELYVHFWNSDEWSLQTEQECFESRLSEGHTAEQRMGGL